MIRNLKILGLALVAVLAMSATTASVASAASFTSAAATTNFEGDGANHVFEITGASINCTTADFKGEATGTSVASVTLTPLYTGCTGTLSSFKVAVTVTGFGHNGDGGTCDYVVRASGTVDLACSSGEVTLDGGTCTVHIPAQTNLGTITYTNGTSGGVGDITATLNLTGIQASHTDGFGCVFGGNGSGKNGSLRGTSTVTGTNTLSNPVSISHDK